jgi:hypothetical protein
LLLVLLLEMVLLLLLMVVAELAVVMLPPLGQLLALEMLLLLLALDCLSSCVGCTLCMTYMLVMPRAFARSCARASSECNRWTCGLS